MAQPDRERIGYVLKMYPRFSETFIVNELLAHEAAGTELHLYSLRPPVDGRFHEALAEVRAPVTYLRHRGVRAADLWDSLRTASARFPRLPGMVVELADAGADDAGQALELAAMIEDAGITHLHAHFGSVATTVARLASLLTGVPYTFTAHAKDIFHEEVDLAALDRKVHDAVACVTVSDFNLAHLRDVLDAGAGVVRVYNGLDLTRFPYANPGSRPPTIVAVGRLVEKKGFADLVRACELLVGQGRDVGCELIGAGPDEAELRAQVAAAGLDDVVELRGALPQGEVRAAIQGAAVLVAPCVVAVDGNRDGLPTVLLEAMALGTPCVATDVTGVPEVVRHGVTGLLTAQHDPAGLAVAIGRLLDEPVLRTRLALAARTLVEENFDVARQAADLRSVFRSAARPGPMEAVP